MKSQDFKPQCSLTTAQLFLLADDAGIIIDRRPCLSGAISLCVDGCYYICIDPDLPDPELRVALVHEIGHCISDTLYSRQTHPDLIKVMKLSPTDLLSTCLFLTAGHLSRSTMAYAPLLVLQSLQMLPKFLRSKH